MDTWNDAEKLEAELLKNDLAIYRGLENWGATLFLGGLALLGKQFAEWNLIESPPTKIHLTVADLLLPAGIGLVAFVFLRIVNARSYEAAKKLFILAKNNREERKFGSLGWLISRMPLTLGSVISCSLIPNCHSKATLCSLLLIVNFFAVCCGAVLDYNLRHTRDLYSAIKNKCETRSEADQR